MIQRVIDYWDTLAYWKYAGRRLSLWQRMNVRFRSWFFKIYYLHPKYKRGGLTRAEKKTLREAERYLKKYESIQKKKEAQK